MHKCVAFFIKTIDKPVSDIEAAEGYKKESMLQRKNIERFGLRKKEYF